MIKLVKQIEVEQDHNGFMQLIEELNNLLAGKAHRLEEAVST